MFGAASDADLITFLGEEGREEAAAMARQLHLIGQLAARRFPEMVGVKNFVTDDMAVVAAEVAPVRNISHSRAVYLVDLALTLRDRLPQVFKRFLSGVIDYRMVSVLVARTTNVEDDVMVDLDEALARRVEKWMKLSKKKLRDRVDMFVGGFDPEAVRVPPEADKHRYIEIDPDPEVAGLAAMTGRLRAEDGAALKQRLEALADTVCDKDPRTRVQRLADACGPLARGEATLACLCATEDCPARANRAAAHAAVIHVLADSATVEGTSDKPGYLPGFGVLPAESVRTVARNAELKPVPIPGTGTEPESGYRPSAKLRDFVRWRDLTCRWPGCDKPAQHTDIDHTSPWPYGPTHPSNTKSYCRIHHLIKTFFSGPGGWSERQLPDGTIELKAPTGHLYLSEPHGAAMFPALGTPTGTIDAAEVPPPNPDRIAMMPRRRQTREQDRRDRITTERRRRAEIIAEEQKRHEAWLAANYKPPPF